MPRSLPVEFGAITADNVEQVGYTTTLIELVLPGVVLLPNESRGCSHPISLVICCTTLFYSSAKSIRFPFLSRTMKDFIKMLSSATMNI